MQQREVLPRQDNKGLYKNSLLCYPFLKWAGGKTQLLPVLKRHIPSTFNRYFEPFLGGGAMFFNLSSLNLKFDTYLSDINEELINTYKVVKDNVEELIPILKTHKINYKKSPSKYYYELRSNINPLSNHIEKAARFITLNKTCYNGLYRVNTKGIFNVPMGRYKNPTICDSDNLRNASYALNHSKAAMYVRDYKYILLEKSREGDFIYLDPPYRPTSGTAYFTRYTYNGFADKDQEELAHVFGKLNDRNCKVLLSNSDTNFIRSLYKDFAKYTTEINVIRAINSIGSKRVGHKELLVRNYL